MVQSTKCKFHRSRAQNVSFTAHDLVTAAKEQIFFLQSVHSCYPSLYQGPLLLAAVRRYVKYWLPLLAELDGYSASWIPLVPPLECGWIWHCHRLNPVAYEKDCQRLFGRVLDPPFIDAPMKEIAVDGSAYIWDKRYPGHPYRLDPKDYLGLSDADVCCEKTPFEVELEQAVYNQKKFYHQVCEPHMIDDQYLKHAVERYKAFLYLIEKCSRELNMHCPLLVPTCDIELIWHTHQLKVEAYREDMIKVVGRVLHLDGTSEGMSMRQRLDEGFKQTQDLWEKIFGFTYERAGATYKCYKSNPLPTPNLPFTHQPTLQGSQRVLSLQCQQEGYLKKRIIMETLKEALSHKKWSSSIDIRMPDLKGFFITLQEGLLLYCLRPKSSLTFH